MAFVHFHLLKLESDGLLQQQATEEKLFLVLEILTLKIGFSFISQSA